jgi:predicted RND superfamily exporter protein
VLLQARYDEERHDGATPDAAVDAAAVHIGRAFVASGLTLLGGFAVLMLSPLPLLADFGVVVSVIVVVALLASLVVLPPLLAWVDTRRRVPDDELVDVSLAGLHREPPVRL